MAASIRRRDIYLGAAISGMLASERDSAPFSNDHIALRAQCVADEMAKLEEARRLEMIEKARQN